MPLNKMTIQKVSFASSKDGYNALVWSNNAISGQAAPIYKRNEGFLLDVPLAFFEAAFPGHEDGALEWLLAYGCGEVGCAQELDGRGGVLGMQHRHVGGVVRREAFQGRAGSPVWRDRGKLERFPLYLEGGLELASESGEWPVQRVRLSRE